MFKIFAKKTFFAATIALALLFDASLSPQAKAASFRFLQQFDGGGILKGRVEGDLQPDENTVTNLSNLFAVYYADFIPPNEIAGVPNQPIIFDMVDQSDSFTLDGSEGIDFSGANDEGYSFELFLEIDFPTIAEVLAPNEDVIDSGSPSNFTAQENDREFFIQAELDKNTNIVPGVGFPELGTIEGYLFFDSPTPTPNVNGGFDYDLTDQLLVFSDGMGTPKFALTCEPDLSIPTQCADSPGVFNATNPGRVSTTGETVPTNPSTFELDLQWDIGYEDAGDPDEVFTTDGTLGEFEPQQSIFELFDAAGAPEAIYNVTEATLEADPVNTSVPEGNNLMGLAGIAGLGFWINHQKNWVKRQK